MMEVKDVSKILIRDVEVVLNNEEYITAKISKKLLGDISEVSKVRQKLQKTGKNIIIYQNSAKNHYS